MPKTYDANDIRARLLGCMPRIAARHTDTQHRYENEDTGALAWSVTTKLSFVSKPYLQTWYAKLAVEHISIHRERCITEGWDVVLEEAKEAANNSRDKSADIGTSAHDAIDHHIQEWIRSGAYPGSAVPFLERLCDEKWTDPRGEEIAACRSYDKFCAERELVPLVSEIRVWYEHGKDRFAGSVDAAFLWLRVRKGRVGEAGVLTLGGEAHTTHDYVPQDSGVWWCLGCGREVEPVFVLGDWKTSNSIKGKDDYAQQGTAYAVALEKAAGLKFDDIWVVRFNKGFAAYEICRVSDRKQAWEEFLAISRAFDAKEKREGSLLAPLEEKVIHRI